MLLEVTQYGRVQEEVLEPPLQVPPDGRPETPIVISTQDLLERVRIQRGESVHRLHQLVEAARQAQFPEPVHESPLGRRYPQGPAPARNLGRPGDACFPWRRHRPGSGPCRQRVREEFHRGSPEGDWRTPACRADGACPPDGVPLPVEIEGGVIGEDSIGPDGRSGQEDIRFVALGGHTYWDGGVDAVGQALQSPLPEVVAHAVLGEALLSPEVPGELLDREDPVQLHEVGGSLGVMLLFSVFSHRFFIGFLSRQQQRERRRSCCARKAIRFLSFSGPNSNNNYADSDSCALKDIRGQDHASVLYLFRYPSVSYRRHHAISQTR